MKRVQLLLSLAVSFAVSSIGADTRYFNPLQLRSGLTGTPEFTTVGDFTRDGRNDLLVASATSIRVLPANGNGTFAPAVTSSIGVADLHVAGAADFNRDDVPDLYLSGDDKFAVMTAVGNGMFGSAAVVNASFDALVIAADFDGDQALDIAAVTNTRPAQLSIFRANGAGGFAAPATVSFPYLDAVAMATGDFDGDGRTDLALAGVFNSWILWNDGGSSFSITELERGKHIAAGDFDGDGASDVLLAASDSSHAALYFGAKGVRAIAGTRAAIPIRDVTSMQARDFDGNGRMDVALFTFSQAVSLLMVNENRTPQAPAMFLTGSQRITATGDVDTDGDADIVFANDIEKDVVSWIPGNGDGTLRAYRSFDAVLAIEARLFDGPTQFELMDVDGDQRSDLVIWDWRENRLNVLRADGAGWFRPVVHTPSVQENGYYKFFTPAGDLDGDGRDDIIFSGVVLHGQPDGSFRTGAILDAGKVWVSELTGDGNADILEADGDLHPGNGNGTFGTPIRTTLPSDRLDTDFADVNNDGLNDVLWSRGNDLRVYLNEGGAKFSDAHRTWSYDILAISDMTGDGLPDLVINRGEKHMQRGKGDGTFHDPGPHASVAQFGGSARAADFDGDGKTDVAAASQILFGNGNGAFGRTDGFRTRQNEYYTLIGLSRAPDGATPDLMIRSDYAHLVSIIGTGAPVAGTQPAGFTLNSSHNPMVYGDGTMLTARVENESTAARPRGAVRFDIGGATAALIGLDADGRAQFGVGFEPGSATVTATYIGDEQFAAQSASLQQQTTKTETKTTAASHKIVTGSGLVPETTFDAGTTIYITAKTLPVTGLGTLKGTITVRRDSLVLGTLPPNSSNRVIIPGGTLPSGSHTLIVEWPGDEHYFPSASMVTIIVKETKPTPRRRATRH